MESGRESLEDLKRIALSEGFDKLSAKELERLFDLYGQERYTAGYNLGIVHNESKELVKM